jgi:hypothetical protein
MTITKKAQGVANAPHVKRLKQERLHVATDDEFGGTAAYINHELLSRGVGQCMGNAQINESRLFTPGNDFYGKTQSTLGALQELGGIFCNAQGVGGNGTYS